MTSNPSAASHVAVWAASLAARPGTRPAPTAQPCVIAGSAQVAPELPGVAERSHGVDAINVVPIERV